MRRPHSFLPGWNIGLAGALLSACLALFLCYDGAGLRRVANLPVLAQAAAFATR